MFCPLPLSTPYEQCWEELPNLLPFQPMQNLEECRCMYFQMSLLRANNAETCHYGRPQRCPFWSVLVVADVFRDTKSNVYVVLRPKSFMAQVHGRGVAKTWRAPNATC